MPNMGGESYRGGEGGRPHRTMGDKDAHSDLERGDQFRSHPDYFGCESDQARSDSDQLGIGIGQQHR